MPRRWLELFEEGEHWDAGVVVEVDGEDSVGDEVVVGEGEGEDEDEVEAEVDTEWMAILDKGYALFFFFFLGDDDKIKGEKKRNEEETDE